MVEEHEESIFEEIPYMDEKLETAKDIAHLGSEERNPLHLRRAYELIEYAWETLQDAEKVLDDQYQGLTLRTRGRDNFLSAKENPYSVDLDKLDENSRTSVIGLAIPQLYQEIMEAREYVMKRHQESEIDLEIPDNIYSLNQENL